MSNPLLIMFEILAYLVLDAWEDLRFVGGKLIELLLSLVEISSQNFLAFILASVLGGVAIYFILKYLFGTTKFFIVVLIIFVIVVIFVLGIIT